VPQKATNPQNLIPAKKGEVRNPNGRPIGAKNRSTVLEKWLYCKIDHTDPSTSEPIKITQEDAVMLALIEKAKSGDVQAIKEIQDTLHGKIKEVTETKTDLSVNKELEQLLDAWITQK
jgi:hypothetical protein